MEKAVPYIVEIPGNIVSLHLLDGGQARLLTDRVCTAQTPKALRFVAALVWGDAEASWARLTWPEYWQAMRALAGRADPEGGTPALLTPPKPTRPPGGIKARSARIGISINGGK